MEIVERVNSRYVTAYPDKLVNLAVEALCVYVSDFLKRIITGPTSPTDPEILPEILFERYQEPCRLLEQNINNHVPVEIAMEVTVKLMRSVNLTYLELMNNSDLQRVCDRVAPLVLKAVVHNSVDSLECLHDIYHPTLLDYYKVENCRLIYKALPLFRGLRAVKLGSVDRTYLVPLDVSGFRDTLEEFRSRSFLLSDLETLAYNCRFIRCLDVDGNFLSQTEVHMNFLRFRNLVELDLSRVIFLDVNSLQFIVNCLSGFTILILDERETADRSQFMTTLGLNLNNISHALPMIERFINLTSLTLSNVVRISLCKVTDLKNLEKLTFINFRFSLIEGLLPKLGIRLKCLNLINVSGVDIKPIGEHCEVLECLHFCMSYHQLVVLPIPGLWYDSIPILRNITTLKLHLDDLEVVKRVLRYACNVRKLVLAFIFNDENFLESLIERQLLTRLEELHWGGISVVQISGDVATINRFYPDGRVQIRHRRV